MLGFYINKTMSNVYHNLSGTTEDKFAIGKRGPTFVRGTGLPTAFIDVPDSSIYLREDTGTSYQKTASGWLQLVTVDMIPVSSYRTTIGISDLDEEKSVVISHNLSEKYVIVQLYWDDNLISPDNIRLIDNNSFRLYLSTYATEGMIIKVCVKV
jgi:hypothetical protein